MAPITALSNFRNPRTISWWDKGCQFGLSSGLLVISAVCYSGKMGLGSLLQGFLYRK